MVTEGQRAALSWTAIVVAFFCLVAPTMVDGLARHSMIMWAAAVVLIIGGLALSRSTR